MHKIYGNNITLTRGDTLIVKIELTKNGEPYTPADGDLIRFALKHNKLKQDGSDFTDTQPLANITIPNDTLLLEITPGTTKTLAFGNYVYDIEITFADGRVDTFIADAKFTIAPEVH